MIVDTLGLLLAVVVHSAGLQDRVGAKLVLIKVRSLFPRLRVIWADGAYAGKLILWVQTISLGRWLLEIVPKDPQANGFQVLPRRWVVERTFAWLGRCRRLSKDYEYLPASSEAMLYVAMIRLMLRRLAQPHQVALVTARAA